jgi:hypothetical protein
MDTDFKGRRGLTTESQSIQRKEKGKEERMQGFEHKVLSCSVFVCSVASVTLWLILFCL